ncbi:uncharacterized protein ACR2FA_011544 [Aphomia sociella]
MDMYHKLATSMDELCNSFNSRMTQYESSLKQFAGPSDCTHKDLPALSKDFEDFRGLMWQAIRHIRSQMELLCLGLDRQETASRRKILLFHGVNGSDENNVEIICDIVSKQLKLQDFSRDDIVACHPLGSDSSKKRPILVRFRDYIQREKVWKTKTSLRNSGVTISEFLTKSRHAVFLAARSHFGVKSCWTAAGKIVIMLPDKTRRKFETMSDLRPLLSKFPITALRADLVGAETTQKDSPPGKTTKPGTRSKRLGR